MKAVNLPINIEKEGNENTISTWCIYRFMLFFFSIFVKFAAVMSWVGPPGRSFLRRCSFFFSFVYGLNYVGFFCFLYSDGEIDGFRHTHYGTVHGEFTPSASFTLTVFDV